MLLPDSTAKQNKRWDASQRLLHFHCAQRRKLYTFKILNSTFKIQDYCLRMMKLPRVSRSFSPLSKVMRMRGCLTSFSAVTK